MFIMRLFLLILSLTFSFQSYTNADDIRDFEIEGMSIGNSLLDFISLEKINKKINSYSDKGYIYKSKKYYALTFDSTSFTSNLKLYDQIQFHFKDKDKSYIIESLAGIKLYKNNINECYSFLNKREKEADKIFMNFKKDKIDNENEGKYSKLLGYFYNLADNSNIFIACEDWTNVSKVNDGFVIVINSSEHQNWLNNEAFK